MDRRGFLKILTQGAAAVPLLPAVAMAAPVRHLLIQQSPIAGFQHYAGEKVFSRLREGMPLRLLREPENRYDKRAVAVYCGDAKLGFVPRIDNAAVSHNSAGEPNCTAHAARRVKYMDMLNEMMDRGERLSARIVKLEQSRNPWDRIRFEVLVDGHV